MQEDNRVISSNVGPSQPSSKEGGNAPTTQRASEAAHHAVDRVSDGAARAEQRLRDAAASGGQELERRRREAMRTGEDAMEEVRRYTREHPLTAAGIAFAAGWILARLSR